MRLSTLTARLVRLYRATNESLRVAGAEWYASARDIMVDAAHANGIRLDAACGVLAAISPGLRWSVNVRCALDIIAHAPHHGPVPTYSYRNVVKALNILNGETPESILGGPKVTAFYRLVLSGGNATDVCVDGHAANIARGLFTAIRGENATRNTPKQLRTIAQAYRNAARILGVAPHVLQATLWISHRGSAN